MADYFLVDVDYRSPNDTTITDKLKEFIGIWGKQVRGVWTSDGAEPSADGSNFDLSKATDLYPAIYEVTGGASIGYQNHNRYAFFGHSYGSEFTEPSISAFNDNGGIAISQVYAFTSCAVAGVGTNFEVTNNPSAKIGIVGQIIKNDDGSVTYNVWWAMYFRTSSTGAYSWHYRKWSDFTIITDIFGETSEPSDDTGSYDDTSEDVDLPELPTIDMCDVGFVSLWKPTIADLQNIGGILWSDSFFQAIVKSFQAPMDSIVSLNIVPSIDKVQVGATANMKLGNYDTEIPLPRITSQFFELDMGTYTISKFWASALDYDPYTSIQLFLPYIGFVSLSPDDVMGKTIHVIYRCDIVTGQIAAYVKVNTETGESVLYSQTGNFSINVPITGANFGEMYKAAIQGTVGAVTGIAGAVATGGAAGVTMGATVLGSAVGSSVTGQKVQYEHSGSTNLTAGYLGIQKCYVIITRPKQSLAQNYNTYVGYPSNITAQLSSLSGFTQIETIHLENVTATDDEKEEIINLLKEGVII